jgi:hypothetical protein
VIEIVVKHGWIAIPENAWRAVVLHPSVGITSASDSTAWRAVARTIAVFALKRGLHQPSQAQEDLSSLMARARAAEAAYAALEAPRPQQRRRRRA